MLSRSRTLLVAVAVPLALTSVRRAHAAPEPAPWATEEDEEHDDRRFEWWHRARAYPAGKIPDRAFVRARDAWSVVPRIRAAGPGRPNGGPPGPPMPSDYGWRSIGPDGVTTTQSLVETPNMGPEAGRASAIAIDPTNVSTLYAGYSIGGVWRSRDDGATWAPLGDRLPSLAIGSIAVAPGNPDTIFVGSGEGALTAGYTGAGILVTMDAGDSWTQLAEDTFGGLAVPRLLIDPTSGDLYAAAIFGVSGRGEFCTNTAFEAPGQGVYRSTDLGATWTLLYAGPTSDLEIDFTASPAHLLTVDQAKGAMYSLDGGATWNASTGLDPDMGFVVGIELSMSPVDPTLVFAGVGKGGGSVFISHDGGQTFTETAGTPAYCGAQCYYDNSVLADPVDPNVLWLGGSLCGIWRTQNALTATPTWINVSAQNQNCGQQSENWALGFVHPDVHALAVVPGVSSQLYAATDGGIARTVDAGVTWERLNSGVSTIQFYAICVDPNDPDAVYGGAQDNGSSMRVGTDTWRGIISGDGGYCAVNPGDSNNVLTTDTAGTVVLTMDRFLSPPTYPFATDPSFCQQDKPGCGDRSSFIAPLLPDPNAADTFYIGTYRVYRSVDKGETWQPISRDVTAGSGSVHCVDTTFPAEDDTLTAIAVARHHSEIIYTGSASGAVSRTMDGGKSWKLVSKKPLPHRWISDVAIDPRDPLVVYAAFSGFDGATPDEPGHVFRSTDGGESWEARAFPADVPVDSLVAHPVGSDVLYAGTDLGALISVDAGKSWQVLGDGLPDVPVYSLRFHERAARILAGTHGRSVWALDFGLGTLAASPSSLSLEGTQGKPNPSAVIQVRDKDPYGSIVRYQAITSAPWLFADPNLGDAAGAKPSPLAIHVDVAKAAIGKNDGLVTLIPTEGTLGARIEIPVHLEVKAATEPNNPYHPPAAATGCDCGIAGGDAHRDAGLVGVALLGLAAALRRSARPTRAQPGRS